MRKGGDIPPFLYEELGGQNLEKLNLKSFQNPGSEYRGKPFWAWNTKLSAEKIKKQITYFKEMGFGGYHMHPRVGLDTEYLGKEYMEAVKLCVEEGKKQGLYSCLYDEDRWPSGYGGGMVTENPKFRAVHLLFTVTPYEEKKAGDISDYNANFATGIRTDRGELLAVYDIVLDEEGYLKTAHQIQRDDVPLGIKWYAYMEENPPHAWYNGGAYVDVLNKKAIDAFIKCIYETYESEVGKEFGKSVPSIFTDEPHMIYKTNLRNANSKEDLFLPWTRHLPEELENRYGISVLECLPKLFWRGKEDGSVRYYFHRMLAELFEEAYAKNIGAWCREKQIAFTGHYLYEETLFMQNRSSGNLMSMYRHMDIPGMDLLFDEVALTTAKQVQSIVRQYGKKGAMSEEYGGTNWNFDFRGHKFQGNWQAVLGITLRVPHLSHMSMRGEGKRDFPASIFYQAPWYKEYKQVEDHFARISYVMEQGESVVRIAVIHPLESYYLELGPENQTGEERNERDRQFQDLIQWLLEANLDFDYLNEALMQELFDGRNFGCMSYDVILIPNLLTLRSTTLFVLQEYAGNGGKILTAGEFPAMLNGSINMTPTRTLEKISARVPFCKMSVIQSLSQYRDVSIEDESGNISGQYIYQLRRCEDSYQLFIAPILKTQKDDMQPRKIVIKIKGIFTPYVLDTVEGDVLEIPAFYEEEITGINHILYAGQAILLSLKKGKQNMDWKSAAAVDWKAIHVNNMVDFLMEEPNVILLDMPEYSLDEEAYGESEEILRIDEKLRERLGFKPRNSSMEQPYRKEKGKLEHTVMLRYKIFSHETVENVCLAIEDIKNKSITWNAEEVVVKDCGYYVDEDFRKVKVGTMVKGDNILEVKVPYAEDTDLEAAYLLGEFGVNVLGNRVEVVKYPKKLSWGGVDGQGFGFYGGNVHYKFNVDCPKGKLKIQIPKYRGAFVAVVVDNIKMVNIVEAPFTWECQTLSRGVHEVMLILFGNRYNTFSHLHYRDDTKDGDARPSYWRESGDNWCYEYNLKPMGILVAPKVEV